MLPGSKAWIISGIVFVPSKHCLFQIRGKNRKKSSFKKWNNCFPISVLFLLLMWTHSHLFTWKVTCAWPSSCCSVLISLLSAAKGMGWQQYSRMRQLDWSQLFGSGIAEVGSFYCPFFVFALLVSHQVFSQSHSCVWDQLWVRSLWSEGCTGLIPRVSHLMPICWGCWSLGR